MPTRDQYRNRIRTMDYPGLSLLWKQVKQGSTPGWDRGKALEYLVLRGFELGGARVVWPFDVSAPGLLLEQIDGVVYYDGLASLIECKDYSEPVDATPIQKLRQQLARRPYPTVGCCFAKRGFTDEAMFLATLMQPQNILLWYGDEIDYALQKQCMCRGLVAKYQNSVERALPDMKINTKKI